ncbi:MBL fold metallo-hydrolase [Desulfatirhabdium butyrativorans]|uniref:MBL fold metallo-hydrolase n=1 Tax=Desulfatirhabdium butyrativorans TaxID=340467 RepID=UPI000410BEF6|nr:MBL fold metallo-hydrolase [Desulfatirhabdium butyrativorans]
MNFFSAHAISTGVLSSLLATAMVMPMAASASETRADKKAVEAVIARMHWLGHDGFWIDAGGTILYIDPYKISGGPKADIILITHSHQDHASVEDVAKIIKPDTVIVTVAAAAEKFPGKSVQIVQPGQHIVVKNIPIETVPAYNTNKFRSPGVPFHPKEAGFVGYILTVDGVRIYHTGDSDMIDEMKDVRCDIALLPVSGIYVMTAEEAAEAAARLRPSVVIPMHVGKGIGSLEDAERFQKLSPVPVKILKNE